jgi:hypothetical protein
MRLPRLAWFAALTARALISMMRALLPGDPLSGPSLTL